MSVTSHVTAYPSKSRLQGLATEITIYMYRYPSTWRERERDRKVDLDISIDYRGSSVEEINHQHYCQFGDFSRFFIDPDITLHVPTLIGQLILQEMMSVVCTILPEDPYEYMMNHVVSGTWTPRKRFHLSHRL